MNNTVLQVLLLSLILILCLHPVRGTYQRKVVVVTTINVLADIARQIGGKYVEVHSIVSGVENPHTYSIKPSDKLLLEKADIYVEIGEPLEGFRAQLLSGIDLSDKIIITCLQLPNIIVLPNKNPHIWLNPDNALIIAFAIKNALINVDPIHKEHYEERYLEFKERISSLKRYIESRTSEIKESNVILVLPAPEPLISCMNNIKVLDTIVKIPGQQPTPHEVASIEELIKKNNVRILVGNALLKVPIAERVAADTGTLLVYFLPLLSVSRGVSDYFSLIRYNVDMIIDAIRYSSKLEEYNGGLSINDLILITIAILEAFVIIYLSVRTYVCS